MTKQVALSEHAYAALRNAKTPEESFSDAVLRLLERSAKDPMAFARRPREFQLSSAAHLKQVEADRDAWR